MKCKRTYCNEAAAPRQIYCSRACAPYANLQGEDPPTPSVKTASSTTQARGAPLGRLSKDGKWILVDSWPESERPKRRRKSARKSESTGEKMLNASGPLALEGGTASAPPRSEPVEPKAQLKEEPTPPQLMLEPESGTDEMLLRIGKKNVNADTVVTLSKASHPSSMPYEEVKQHSLSLISDSAKLMHELMSSSARAQDGSMRTDPKRINAACNCAKQMASLMRLQLEVIREIKK